MSEENISLFELLDLAIGTPQRGAVNFSALHALLHAVLGQLDIRELKTPFRDAHPDALVGVTPPQLDYDTEGEQHQLDGDISTVQQEREASSSSPTPSSGPAATDQWRLHSRIQTCEDGVAKAMKLIQEVQSQNLKNWKKDTNKKMKEETEEETEKEMKEEMEDETEDETEEEMTEEMEDKMEDETEEEMTEEMKKETKELRLQKKMVGVPSGTASDMEKCCLRVDALEKSVRSLRNTLQKYPDPKELSQCVTWDDMQSTLLSERENLQKELVNSGVVDPATHIPFNSNFTAVRTVPSHTGTPSSPQPVQDTGRTEAPSPPAISQQISTGTLKATEPPSIPSGPPQHPAAGPTAAGAPLAREASGSETAEALTSNGKLKERFGKLEARVAALEEDKVDQSQLMHLKKLITNHDSQDALNNLMDQLNQQQDVIDSLIRDRDKLDMLMNVTGHDRESTSEAASGSEESDSKASHELRHQIYYLRKSLQKVEDDIKQLKARQASSMERAKDRHLQDQLDDPRGMLQDMMQFLTCQLSDAELDESNDSQGIGQSKDQRPELTTSTVNMGRKLSLLFQHYEQLQDTVNSLLQQQTGGRAGPLKDIEELQLVNDVQKVILHLQAECQKLHETTRCLHEDNRQKQSHIEELYKTTEELGEKKADKEMVASEIKADKFALESKVSRLQFDSVTEQLNVMFHELLNKVTGHEQDWHKVVNKLSTEMERKLNRMELDSVKDQLENRWKNIHEKLQAQGAPEHEDAAGIKKQLVDRFHCLSCDRPVVMHTPGQHLAKQPSTPGFPSHKSIRPFTVYALEQFRQHYRSLKPGSNRYNFVGAGRRRKQLQKSHTVMCRQIESIQRKQWDSTPPHGTAGDSLIQNQPGVQHERISEMTDYGHMAASRSCGGSHTVTLAGQRRPVLQFMKHNPQTEVDAVIPAEEVDIIGLDGHIYKGRLNASTIRNTETKLPTISTKDGMCKTKDKAKSSSSHKTASSPEVGHSPPVYSPHSAKSAQCSRSTSSSSGRDWPVSALGCTSQLGSVSPASAAAVSLNTEPASEQLLNL
ncbi:glutamine-rich protein 2 isoform X1 [Etheostoma spectabile]|uniref:glutamine-rich protein 2 isoform X1 n=1 Tax=Etheostoma spectabile TaxID=54343 RepID=UPI0013AEDD3A|nr:glutamine-rich protein 2-like isoform X1 [Etheostoma spectabile]